MIFRLLVIGKTELSSLEEMIKEYLKRVNFYTKFVIEQIPNIKNTKNLSKEEQKIKEGELLLQQIEQNEYLILLDERGKEYTSVDFSTYIQKVMNMGLKQCTFAIGGPFGFSSQVYERANGKCALSKMTFSHQMVRLFFVEQLYRAFTILNNEPYHHA